MTPQPPGGASQPTRRTWRSLGAREGLYVLVASEHGGEIRVATHDDASLLVLILNSLEESAAFGQQCYQDRCENAYVEASVVKKVEERALKWERLHDHRTKQLNLAIAKEKGGAP